MNLRIKLVVDWDDLRQFLAVAREGQVLGASKRLGTSQSNLSRRIAALEASFKQRLFDRTTRGCTLTDAGKALYTAAERMEIELLSATSTSALSGTVQGTVRIGAPDGFGSLFLAPRLGDLCQRYPNLRVQLVPMPRNFSLSEREADIAIVIGRPTAGRLRTRKLIDYTVGLYAGHSYIAKHGLPQTPEQLLQHRLVGYVDDLLYSKELAYHAEIAPRWHSSIEIATAIGQMEAVKSGAGIGILHDFMVAENKDLTRVLPDIAARREYWLAWHENLAKSPAVQAVVAFVGETVQTNKKVFTR
jgi:DNA-binding transcriptional LysR family regulator